MTKKLNLAFGPEVVVRSVVFQENRWLVSADGAGIRSCPECGGASTSRHSWHFRHLQDLPIQGVTVVLKSRVGRWRCLNERCARKTFVERLTTAFPFARITQRVTDLVRLFGHAAGGRTSEKLLARLAMPVSDNAILRQLTRYASERRDSAPLRAIGIDDWSWRKGFNYGTIIVDLERRIVSDVLETRSAKETADWSSNVLKLKSSAATAAVFTHRVFDRGHRKPDKSLIAFICCKTCAKASRDT